MELLILFKVNNRMKIKKVITLGVLFVVILTTFMGLISEVSVGNVHGKNPDKIIDDENILHKVWQERTGKKSVIEIYYVNNRWKENSGIGNDKNPTKQILSSETPSTYSINPNIEQTSEGWIHVTWVEKHLSKDIKMELWSVDGGLSWLKSPPSESWMRVGNYFKFKTEVFNELNNSKDSFYHSYLIKDIGKNYISFRERTIQEDVVIEVNTIYNLTNRKLVSADGHDLSSSDYYNWLWISDDDISSRKADIASVKSSMIGKWVKRSTPTFEFFISNEGFRSNVYYQLDGGLLYKTQDYWNTKEFKGKTWANFTKKNHLNIKELYPKPSFEESSNDNLDHSMISLRNSQNSIDYYEYYYPEYDYAWDYTWEGKDENGAGSAHKQANSNSNKYDGTLYGYTNAYAHGGSIGSAWAKAKAYGYMYGPRGGEFIWDHSSSYSQMKLRVYLDGSANAYASLTGWWGSCKAKTKIFIKGWVIDDSTGYEVDSKKWTLIDKTAKPFGIPSYSRNWNEFKNLNLYGDLYRDRDYRFKYKLFARSFSTAIGVAAATSYAYMDMDISYFRVRGYT